MPDCKILKEALQAGLVVHRLPGLSLAIQYSTTGSSSTTTTAGTTVTTTTTATAATTSSSISIQQLQLVAGPGITPSTVFGIGSITKTFVAIVILQLVQEGRLDLDRTALEYLLPSPVEDAVTDEPADSRSSTASAAAVVAALLRQIPNGRSATLRHLLSHQSGIPTWEFVPAWIRNARGVHLDPTKHWDSIEALTYVVVPVADAEDDAKGDATTTTSSSVAPPVLLPSSPPGERYGYSNTNYTILGHVVEAVTGQSIAHELRRRLLAPLSLRSAFFHYNHTDESDEQREERESDHDIAMTTVAARCHFPDRLYHYVTEAFVRDAGVPINYFDDVVLDNNEGMLVTSTSCTTGATTAATTQQQRQLQHHQEPPNNKHHHHHHNIPTPTPEQQVVQQVQRPPMMDTTRATNLSCEWAAGALCMTMADLCTLGVALAKVLALYREGNGGGEGETTHGSYAATTATTTTTRPQPRRHRRPQRRLLLGPAAAEQMFTYRPPQCDVMELDGHGFAGSSDNKGVRASLRATGKEYCLGICHDVSNDVWQHGGLTLSFSSRLMILPDGTVIACATNVGQMHSGFGDGQSPWDQFVAGTLLPAVRAFLASANSTSITNTSSS